MSNKHNWVAIDNQIIQELEKIKRPLSKIEAMVFFSVERSQGEQNSIKGYAETWGWSRNKVRKFITEIMNEPGHKISPYARPIRFIDKHFLDQDGNE